MKNPSPPMATKKILVLSVSAGAGHTRAAEAIRAYANLPHSGASVTHLDVMQFASSTLRKLYTDFYISLVNKAPSLWGQIYNFTNRATPDSKLQQLRRGLERWNARRLQQAISDFGADAIICTHFLPAEILSTLVERGDVRCPVWVQVTDFDLHRSWLHPHITGYFAANDEVAFRLRDEGIAADRVHVTGIPIMPSFAQSLDRATCAAELGLDPLKKTFLLMGGGAGVGSLELVAERLLALSGDFQLVALAGKNAAALHRLELLKAKHPQRLFPQGFTNQVERLMACADVAITKPGGLTTSECLAMGLPMIVNAPIPGQEERNADFLLEQGVAMAAFDSASLAYRVLHLLVNPDKLADMRDKARMLGRADAAQKVLNLVLTNNE
jgi:processive 1,2-diacylglycerol beta-glucosyltransferase